MTKEIPLQERIRDIVNKYDPIGLLKIGCPDDEYDSGAKLILDGLPKCKSVAEVNDLVYNTFVEMFEYGYNAKDRKRKRMIDPGGAGKKEDYRQMAEEIHSKL